MAGYDREAAYAALLTRLQTLVPATLVGVSRRLPPAQPSVPPEQPCAFVPSGKEIPNYSMQPYFWTLHPAIIVYARTDDQGQAPSSLLAPIVKAIETALQAAPGEAAAFGSPTTLGGTCAVCSIGQIEYGEGIGDGQGVVFIPLEIVGEVR